MAGIAAIFQSRDKLRRAFRQNDFAAEDDGVAGKMDSFFRRNVDQVAEMIADRALAVFVERVGKPKRATVRQRTEAGIDVIKTRIDQFHRDHETAEDVRDGAMRVNVGPKFVATEKHVAAE